MSGRRPDGDGAPGASTPGESTPGEPVPVRVYVGLGSNLGDRRRTIDAACAALRALASDERFERSALYESAPMGPADQPDYLNAVCTFSTALAPHALLAELQRVECAAGRVRPAPRWSARTLDLDLLLYGGRTVATADLVVPHPGIAERPFVLRPLIDLDPDLEVPGRGDVGTLLEASDPRWQSVRRLPDEGGP